MSDTRTVEQLRQDAQFAVNRAKDDLAFAEGEAKRVEDYFNSVTASPDFQETLLAFWDEVQSARRKSGLGIREFAHALFAPQVVVKGDQIPDGYPIGSVKASMAHRLTLALYPNAEKTQDFEASLKEVRTLVIASEMRQHAAKAKAIADTGAGPPPEDTSAHAQVGSKLGEAVRALADAALKLGAVAPWLGETYSDTARDIAKQAEALGCRTDTLKQVVTP